MLISIDKPFTHLDPSSMSKKNGSQVRPPPSPTPPKSPFRMNRSVTTPLPQRNLAPRSPDLPSNLDCAFPPFPSKRSATPQSAQSESRDWLEPTVHQDYAAPSPLFAPLSPRTNGGENIAKRMNSIAPGPFDGRADRRPSTSSASRSPLQVDATAGHIRSASQDSKSSNRSAFKQRTSVASSASRGSAYSTHSSGLPLRPKSKVATDSLPPPPPLPATTEQNESIDAFLDRLKKESMPTSPTQEEDMTKPDLVRHDSREKREPPPRPRRPSGIDLRSGDKADLQPSALLPRSSDTSPSRNQSIGQAPGPLGDTVRIGPLQPPPLAPPNFPNDTPMNPLHTPSDSGLSDDSYASSGFRSVASSRSSPPGSVTGHSREASKLSRSEILEETFQRSASPESYAGLRTPPTRSEEKTPSRSYPKMNAPEPLSQTSAPVYPDAPESPMDPAIQLGTSFNRRPREPIPQRDPALNLGLGPVERLRDARPRLQGSRPSSKGNCRGCSEPIVGKSVKDSSGRLTGRYHKQCFVCRTCSDPFPTAEFYVFDNSPFCEHHYHELNGSLCAACDRGIEGQYLETDNRRKFHPRCFTCTTCRIVLRDDYFEVGGKKYCDRHAQHAAAPPQNYLGPGGYRPRMEKRRTRLMMMA
jgi:hypothetical protein